MHNTDVGHPSDHVVAQGMAGSNRGVTLRFMAFALALLGAVVAPLSAVLAPQPGWIGLAGSTFFLGAIVTAIGMDRHYPHDRLGLANMISLLRMAMVSPLVLIIAMPGLLAEARLAWGVLGLAVVSLSLDGVDGFFARRQGLSSRFGARFDVEVDSLFALLLAVLAFQLDKAGAWVLILGLARYLFVAAGAIWPWLMADLPERFSRKAVCVIQIGVLIALLAPIVVAPVSLVLAGLASLLVAWSFAVDIVWLARRRA